VLTAPTWTYNAAGGPNPFIVPARHGLIATAINTDTGATVVGLGRKATRFTRPLKLQSRGVAIFAQPTPFHLPERVYAIGYSTMAGVAPRVFALSPDGEVQMEAARPELAWREGRTISVTETPHGPVLHLDDRHLVLDSAGNVVADVPRRGVDAPFVVEAGRLFAHDGQALAIVDLVTGQTLTRWPLDGRPTAVRYDAARSRVALRVDRLLCSLGMEDESERPRLRAWVGGLAVMPSVTDSNLRAASGGTGGLECVDDDGSPRWTVLIGGATSVHGVAFLTGGELVMTATGGGADRVLITRETEQIFERPRAGAAGGAGCIARVGDRVAVVVAPGAEPSGLIEFGAAIDCANLRGGGAAVYERPGNPGPGKRMMIVDPAGAPAMDVSEGAAGARWAVFSDGLLAVPRANAARVDLYDTGAPA